MNRILFVYQNTFSAIGGIQTFNKYFISSLEDIQKESNSIRCELLSVYDKSSDIKSTLPFSTANSNKLLAITKLITKTYSYDTFIFGHVNLAPLAVLIKVLNPKAKIIFCTHGIDVWHKLSKSTEWIMNKSTILAVSQFTANKLKEYNKNLNDIKIFPNCIKIGNYDENLKNNFNENKFNILSVTRLDKHEQYKGIHTVISALALLIENIPNIKYTIIGKGDDIERLKNLANNLNASKYIDFLGFVDNIQSYYKYCDIFTLPSKNEGFGIVYLEAMQYKKPVIAVNYGGPTDVIINEESGYLCEFEDEKCLAEKINLLFKNKELSKELGENGYRRLMDNFTYRHFKNNLRGILI